MLRRLCEVGCAASFVLLGACSGSGGNGAASRQGGAEAGAPSLQDASPAGSGASGGVDAAVATDAVDASADASRAAPVEDAAEPAEEIGDDAGDGTLTETESGAADAPTMETGAVAECDAAATASTLSAGLVSWWRAEGDADDSVGQNNGVADGVTYVSRAGGQAFDFDGTTADVQIPTSTTLDVTDGYTIALWIDIPSLPAELIHVVEKLVSHAEDKSVDLNPDGTIGFHIFPVIHMEAPLNSVTALTLNTWHHVAATYDGTSANIYLDGRLDSSQAASGTIDNGTGALGFAHNTTRGGGYLSGALDEIRWYSRALSASEITALASGCN